MVIAVFKQLTRPVTRFIFSAEILRPPHPFVAPRVARYHQAIFIRNSISHAFPYRVREDAGFPATHPEIQTYRPMPKDQPYELINSPLVFCAMRVSDRETEAKNCGDTVMFKKR